MDEQWLDSKCFTVDKRDPLTKVLGWIAGDRRDVPVVCHDGRPYGLVDARRIMDGRPHSQSHISHVDWPVPVVTEEDSPTTVLRHFANSNAPYLPAHVGKRIQVVRAEDLLDAFDDGPTAEAAMGAVPVFGPEHDVEDVMQGFRRNAIDLLPYADTRGPRGVIRRDNMVQYFLEPECSPGKGDRAGQGEPVRDDPLQDLVDERIRILAPDASFEEAREAVQQGPAFVVRDNKIEGALNAAYLLSGLYDHRKHSPGPSAQVAQR